MWNDEIHQTAARIFIHCWAFLWCLFCKTAFSFLVLFLRSSTVHLETPQTFTLFKIFKIQLPLFLFVYLWWSTQTTVFIYLVILTALPLAMWIVVRVYLDEGFPGGSPDRWRNLHLPRFHGAINQQADQLQSCMRPNRLLHNSTSGLMVMTGGAYRPRTIQQQCCYRTIILPHPHKKLHHPPPPDDKPLQQVLSVEICVKIVETKRLVSLPKEVT